MSEQDFRFISTNRNDRKDFQPLVLNPNSHPGYTPVKLNIKTANDLKLTKSKPPEKPMVPYMRYSRKVWDSVKAANPEAKLWEIGKIIGQMWRDLGDYEKQEYISDYENAKAEYCEQIKNYHNSPQYQNFLSNVVRKKGGRDDFKMTNGMSTNALVSSNIINTMNSANRQANSANNDFSLYAIEPAEDDGIDDSLSVRHVAANRFNRNHRLLNEIFNEYTVPDNRSIVTSQRMEQLKKQVTSLELHQEKLKQELVNIEEKYELKKKKILDASTDFQSELDKLNQFTVTETQLKTFYDKHYETLEKQWKDHVDRVVAQNGTSILDSEAGVETLRNHLESIVSNQKAITTPPLASSITLVVFNQVVEPTLAATQPPPSAPNTTAAHTNPPPNAIAPSAPISQTGVHHPTNTMVAGAPVVAGQSPSLVVNQAHNPYQQQQQQPPHPPQQPQQQPHIFNQQQQQPQQQMQPHPPHPQQVAMHGMPIQNPAAQAMANQPHPPNQHHMHIPHQPAQSQTPGPHHPMPGTGVPIQQQPQQPHQPGTPQVPQMAMVQAHSGAPVMSGMHHPQMVPNQQQQGLHPQQQQQTPQPHMQPNMMQPQTMMPAQPGANTEYQYQNQMAHQGYNQSAVYGQQSMQVQQTPQQQMDPQQYATQMNYSSPQQQYQLQQQQQYLQRAGSTPGPAFMTQPGQRMVNPAQIQSPNPNQMMMMQNRPPVPGQMQQPGSVIQANTGVVPQPTQAPPNQAYQNYMMNQTQFNQQTQQFRTSSTPPINNPTSMVSPSQHMQAQQQPAGASTTPVPGMQTQMNPAASGSGAPQSPMVNRIQPQPGQVPPQTQQQQQQQQNQMMQQANPAQAQPQMQVRPQLGSVPTQQQMNYYNPQMPPQAQPHMYGMVQQPHYAHQQAQQMNPYGAPNAVPNAAVPGQQPTQTGQQAVYPQMMQTNQGQPVMMQPQQPNAQPNMMYAQHPQNMMYTMPPQQQQPQQVIMMQQQQQQQQVPGQPQMMNQQYAMYQTPQQMPVQQPPQQSQMNPAVGQPQPQQSVQNQPQQPPSQPSTPQPAEPKTKGKKKQKTSKAAAETS